MHEIKKAKAAEMFHIINELLATGQSARITVTGSSMVPFLREGKDSVELSRTSFADIKRSDIVLIRRDDGRYVIHRVLRKKKDCFYMVGDAQQWIEGPLRPDQLLAVITSIWHGNKKIKCSNLIWKSAATLWLWLLPFRGKIFRCVRIGKKVLRRIFNRRKSD